MALKSFVHKSQYYQGTHSLGKRETDRGGGGGVENFKSCPKQSEFEIVYAQITNFLVSKDDRYFNIVSCYYDSLIKS